MSMAGYTDEQREIWHMFIYCARSGSPWTFAGWQLPEYELDAERAWRQKNLESPLVPERSS